MFVHILSVPELTVMLPVLLRHLGELMQYHVRKLVAMRWE